MDQRGRILEAALRLMARQGVHATGMRQLAAACELNPATLYHYFPSKADLLSAVIGARHYEELLADVPPTDLSLTARDRLAGLLAWIWDRMADHADMWQLLLGESLRGEHAAIESAAGLTSEFEHALARWLRTSVPELPSPVPVTARVVRGLVYGFFIEYLPLPAGERARFLRRRATEISGALLPG